MFMKPQLPGSLERMKTWLAIRRRMIYVDGKAGELSVRKRRSRKGSYCWLQCVRRHVVQSLISLEIREQIKALWYLWKMVDMMRSLIG